MEFFESNIIFFLFIFTLIGFIIYLIKDRRYHWKQRKEKEKLMEDLRRKNELKDEFISIASHQLRTPLTVVKGYISMLKDGKYEDRPEKKEEMLSKIFQATDKIVSLVDDLLNISKIKQGSFNYEKRKGNIIDTLEDALDKHEEGFNSNEDVELVYNGPENKGDFVLTYDEEKMEEALGNVVGNSLKYTREGPVYVSVSREEGCIFIEIKDTGIGITDSEKDRIFNKFERGRHASDIKPEGTGLGLYFSKKVIEAHGGKIWAESEGKGKGSTFNIKLPVDHKNNKNGK